MGKGTPAFGRRMGQTLHIRCRRCGRRAYNVKQRRCAACSYGESTRIRRYSWQTKTLVRERVN